MADLTIIRGLPGSGKSTLAAKLAQEAPEGQVCRVWEADMFFYRPDGTYAFDDQQLKAAHAWCLERVREDLLAGCKVLVSNTFVQLWEMSHYLDLADELGKTVEVLKVTGDYGNLHGATPAGIALMKTQWEDFPGEKAI